MAVDGEIEVGFARDGDNTHTVASALGDAHHCEGNDRAIDVATLPVDEGRDWGRNEPG
jgi:hypothetical protein